MPEMVVKLVGVAALFIQVFAAWWIWRDANRLKRDGVEVNSIAWVVLVFLMWPVGIPLYLFHGRKQGPSSPPEKARASVSPEPLVWGVVAFLVAITLSMVVTWNLLARFPILDDDAIALGLVGFFVVLFFDLVAIYFLIGPKVRKGERREAAGLAAGIFGLGLLVALAVGVLPWSIQWIVQRNPWVSTVFPYAIWILLIAQIVWNWKLRRARRRAA
jgi:hypothetical protein